jgi:hypothetical protein
MNRVAVIFTAKQSNSLLGTLDLEDDGDKIFRNVCKLTHSPK